MCISCQYSNTHDTLAKATLVDYLSIPLAWYSHGLVLNSVRVESRVSNFLQISKQPNKIKKKGRENLLKNFVLKTDNQHKCYKDVVVVQS